MTKRKMVANVETMRRVNNTRHFRAVLIPKVKELLATLQDGWPALGPLERGKCIAQLISLGCSKRGIGRELKVSATNIRRFAEIAELPESDRNAIDSGQSAKKILIAKKMTALQREMRRRIDQDASTGVFSDDIASIILEFCRTGYQLRKKPIMKAMLPTFMDNVGTHLRKFQQTEHRPPKAPKKLGPRELFRKTRPGATKNSPTLVYQGEWLAEALWLIAPESPIRESALIKARKRAGELLPRRTPIESFKDESLVSLAKSIERSNLNWKENPDGLRSLQRQGGVSPPAYPRVSRNTGSRDGFQFCCR